MLIDDRLISYGVQIHARASVFYSIAPNSQAQRDQSTTHDCHGYPFAICCVRETFTFVDKLSSRVLHFSKEHTDQKLCRIYLAVSFLSVHEASSVVAVSWYIGAVAEVTVHLGLSSLKALSLSDTHLSERMNLLTLIILGEGVLRRIKQHLSSANWSHRSNHYSEEYPDCREKYLPEEQRRYMVCVIFSSSHYYCTLY